MQRAGSRHPQIWYICAGVAVHTTMWHLPFEFSLFQLPRSTRWVLLAVVAIPEREIRCRLIWSEITKLVYIYRLNVSIMMRHDKTRYLRTAFSLPRSFRTLGQQKMTGTLGCESVICACTVCYRRPDLPGDGHEIWW